MKAVILLIFLLAAAVLPACGDDGGTSAGTNEQATFQENERATFEEEHPGSARYGSPPLEFEADPDGDLAYTTDEVVAKEGNVTIEFTNPQSTPHNVAIEVGGGGRVVTETVSNSFAAVTITLNTKEKFTFYCTVPGHKKAGMEGVVRVDPRN